MNRDLVGFFVSVALLFLGYMGINSYYASKKAAEVASLATPTPAMQTPQAAATAEALATAGAPVAASPEAASPVPTVAPVETTPANPADLKIDLPQMAIEFVQNGACIGPVQLKEYKETTDEKAERASLQNNYALCKAFGARIGSTDLRNTISSVERTGPTSVRFVQRSGDFEIAKTFDFTSSDYRAKFDLQVRNLSGASQSTSVAVELGATSEKRKSGFLASQQQEFHEVAYFDGDELKRTSLPFEETPTRDQLLNASGIRPSWIASGSLYFVIAMFPKARDAVNLVVERTGFNIQRNRESAPDRTVYEAWLSIPVELAANETKSFSYDLYMGPKIKSYLDNFEGQKLQKVIDYGFFEIVAWPIFYALKAIHKVVGNWGLAILILTIGLKMLFYPLTLKAYLASRKLQKVQPKINELKEKYKDDRQKQSQEMMALMSQAGANPMSGCLPILPQIPVFFALFAVLQHTFELRHAPFFGWIHDLSAMDPFYILPVVMAILMYVQQRLTPMPSMDPAQQKMMQFLPLVFALFMFSFPSGLVLYSLTNTAMTLIQQQYMIRKYKDA